MEALIVIIWINLVVAVTAMSTQEFKCDVKKERVCKDDIKKGGRH